MKSPILGRALREERRALVGALGAGLMVALSTIGLAATSAWLIVRAAQHPVVLSLSVPMGLVQLFALAKAAGRYVERTQTHASALAVMARVRGSVARVLEPLVPAGLGPRSADVVDAVLGDVDRVQDLLTAVVGPLIAGGLAGVMTILVSGVLVPWSALSLAMALVLSAVVIPWGAARLGERGEVELDDVRRGLLDLFDRVAQSGDEYVVNGASDVLSDELERLERRYDAANRRRTLMRGLVSGLGTLVSGLSVIAAVVLSALALRHGTLSTSLVAVPALLSVASLELVGGVIPVLVGLQGDRAALTRLEDLAHQPPPVVEPAILESATLEPASDETSSLGLRDVSVLRDGHAVIAHASATFNVGDVVVVSGRSGGGKTTLARLFAKFLDPTHGELHLGARRYGDLTSYQVRERVGFVDDTPHVFSTTLADNLRLADRGATDAELLDALTAVGLSGMLALMPEGLATRLGETSTGLSGGEQRRLGVAREFLAHRRVVVFDEPTEGLDDPGARDLVDAITRRYANGLVVLVSHQLDDQRVATRHVTLEGGALCEDDTSSCAGVSNC